MLLRSYLFAPGANDRILAKVVDAGADAAVLDLEDAVAASEKDAARAKVAALLEARGADAPCSLHVRVNRDAEGYSEADLAAVVVPGVTGIRLPKCEDPAAIAAAGELIGRREQAAGIAEGTVRLYATVESAVGLHRLVDFGAASPRLARCTFGSVDFLADLGARDREGRLVAHARLELVLRSRVAGLGPPIDGVHTDVADVAGVRAAAERARDLGMFGKSVIHPSHIAVVNTAFTPSEEEVAWATRVTEAFAAAEAEGNAAITVDGEFVDPAVVARARGVLALSDDESHPREDTP